MYHTALVTSQTWHNVVWYSLHQQSCTSRVYFLIIKTHLVLNFRAELSVCSLLWPPFLLYMKHFLSSWFWLFLVFIQKAGCFLHRQELHGSETFLWTLAIQKAEQCQSSDQFCGEKKTFWSLFKKKTFQYGWLKPSPGPRTSLCKLMPWCNTAWVFVWNNKTDVLTFWPP